MNFYNSKMINKVKRPIFLSLISAKITANRIVDKICGYFEEEYHQLSLWYFIFFIYGIATYYIYEIDLSWPVLSISILGCLILVIGLHKYFFSKKTVIFGFFALSIASFLFGVACAKYHTSQSDTPLIRETTNAEIEATIIASKPTRNGVQFVLSDVALDEALQQGLNLRINVKSAHNKLEAAIGDRIRVFAKLYPLQSSIIPGGFDFGFYMYMDGIGGSGYSRAPLEILSHKEKNSAFEYIETFRENIYQSLIQNLGSEKGNFVAAILIGHTSGIDEKIADDMRDSGVSHILSVSGLHLSLVAMIFFSAARVLLNLSNNIAYRYDVKIIAAIISIIASFAYLLLTGSKIAATRAFIMTAIFIIANMIGRFAYPMRSVFIAAFVILVISPEFVMHPSFQLSFSAVICLISGYQFYLRNMYVFGSNVGLINTLKFYLIANIYSSVIASFATGPFVIFHFFKFANYSILMNLLAVPLMSFIIMPFGCLALILFGSGLEGYLFKFIGYFVGLIIDSAAETVRLPGSIWHFGYISDISLAVYAFGFFFVCVFQTSIRHLGFLFIIISCIMMAFTPQAAFIYDTHYKAVGALKAEHVMEITSDRQISPFNSKYWMHWYGALSLEYKEQNLHREDAFFQLNSNGYLSSADVKPVKVWKGNNSNKSLSINYRRCKSADVMVITSPRLSCGQDIYSSKLHIDYEKYLQIKTLVIFFDEESNPYIEYTKRNKWF